MNAAHRARSKPSGQVLVTLNPGEGFRRQAVLALRYVARVADRATIIITGDVTMRALDEAARQLVMIVRREGSSLRDIAVRAVPAARLGLFLRDASTAADTLLVPEFPSSFEAHALDLGCPVLHLSP